MTLARYEVFDAVVKLCSITKAAYSLNLTQSAVSYSIASLESEFGFPILIRSRSGISLTTDGERMLKYIRTILHWNEKMKQEAASINNIEVGIVRIAAFNSVCIQWLPLIIKAFSEKHPFIEIRVFQGGLDDIERSITNGDVDFGFVVLPTLDSLETLQLIEDELLCIVSHKHPLSNQDKIKINQLEGESLIISRSGNKDVKRLVKEAGFTLNTKFEMADDDSIMAFVENNIGISILPELVIKNDRNKFSTHSFEPKYHRTICLAATSFKEVSPASAKFIDFVKIFVDSKCH